MFRDLLAITLSDWRYLRNQLVAGLAKADVREVRTTHHDTTLVQYEAAMAVKGLNGSVKPVRTAWKFGDDGVIELVTAYIDDRRIDVSDLAPPADPWLLTRSTISDDDWRRLYDEADAAAKAAADAWIPTPVRVNGHVAPEGQRGWATIRLDSALSGLGAWLLRNGLGYPGRPGVALAYQHPTQSAERSEAYAMKFAEMLGLNGVSSELRSYLD
jgi:hypothetical protein